MKKLALISILGLACALFIGCGGGSRSVLPGIQSTSDTGRAVFTVVWPQPTRLVPAASNSVRVDIKSGTKLVISKVLPRPASGNQATATFDALPPGNLTAIAAAYPMADGGGVAQAQASAPLAIQANQTSTITLTMGSTIDHLEATPPSLSLQTGETVQLTVTAYDVQHQIVLLSAIKVTFTSADPNIATVNNSGLVQGGVQGATQITITDTESGKSVKIMATSVGIPSGLPDNAWAKFHGDNQNTGRGSGQGATGVEVWTYPIGSGSNASPVLSATGIVYIGTLLGDFIAIDGATGKKTWSYHAGNRTDTTAAVGANGVVYFGSQDGTFYAMQGGNGSLVWKFSPNPSNEFFHCAPAIGADGTVYVGSDANLYALNGATGSTLWKFPAGGESAPALGPDGTVYFTASDGSVYAVDGGSGTEKWKRTLPFASLLNSPVLGSDGTVYIGSVGLYALDGATGATKWQVNAQPGGGNGGYFATPALGTDGTVYASADDAKVYALDRANGQIKWTFTVDQTVPNTYPGVPILDAAGILYVGTNHNSFYALNSKTGVKQWSSEISSTIHLYGPISPALGPDGTIYLPGLDGKLHAIR